MEKIDIVLWAIGGGFIIVLGTLKIIWNDIKLTRVELKEEIKDLGEKVTDIDRRLCRLEGAFGSREFCVLKDDRQNRKAD
jgi:hypothetical protein